MSCRTTRIGRLSIPRIADRPGVIGWDGLTWTLRKPGDPCDCHALLPTQGWASGPERPNVKCLRRYVGAAGPTGRPQLLVEPDLTEVVGIRKRLEDTAPVPDRKIDIPFGAVLEAQSQAVVSNHLNRGYVNELGYVLMLRQRREGPWGVTSPAPRPPPPRSPPARGAPPPPRR